MSDCPKCGNVDTTITGIKPVRIPSEQGGGWDTVTCYECPDRGEVEA